MVAGVVEVVVDEVVGVVEVIADVVVRVVEVGTAANKRATSKGQ